MTTAWSFTATCKCETGFIPEGRTAGAGDVNHFCRQVGAVVSCPECGQLGRIDVTLTLYGPDKRRRP